MKLRRLLAASAAVAVASAATVTSFATVYWGPTGNSNNSGLIACLVSDNGTPTVLDDASLAYDVTKVVITAAPADFEETAALIDGGVWIGGAVCFCCPSLGWAQKTFDFSADSEVTVTADEENEVYILTYDNGTPIFAKGDIYCQIHLHDYAGAVEFTVEDVALLNADGVDVREAAVAAPETPVENETETPAEPTEEAAEETEEVAVESEEIAEETEEIVEESEEVSIEIDPWDAYDADAMAALNEEFQLGVTDQIDIYDLVGDDWANLAKVEATFVWTDLAAGWCGGGGIGGGAVLADGSNWLSGPEFGAANANAALVGDGTATQTVIDITENPLTTIATVDEETGDVSFGKIFIQNWWNGVESGAQVAAITAYDADGNVIGEITYDVDAPEAPADETPAVDTQAPTTDNKGGSPDTGVAGVAAAAGIVALAGVAVVASRKRK